MSEQTKKSKHTKKNLNHWGRAALLMALVVLLAACGGSAVEPEPTAAPSATETTATTEPAQEVQSEVQSESPLNAPESPLDQPESPLTTESTEAEVEAAVAIPQSRDEAQALVASTAPPSAEDGFGSISGLLFSHNLEAIVPGTQFYLTPADEVDGDFVPPAVYFGPRENGEDVYGFSNEAGLVALDNIPPGNYYLAVWTVYNWLLAYSDPDASSPMLVTIEEGDELNLEMLYVDWP